MLFCSICSANASSIKVPLGILKDPSFEDNGSAKTLPKILSFKCCTTSPPSIIDLSSIPSFVSQSSSLITRSCATSTNLRVK